VGTLPYIAPEILDDESDQKYLPKSDVYSYGMVLWEILARQKPWDGKSARQILVNVMFKGLREPIPTDAPAVLATTIDMARVQEPEQRPSMMKILEHLEASPVEDDTSAGPKDNFTSQKPNRGRGGRGGVALRGNFTSQLAGRSQAQNLSQRGQFARGNGMGRARGQSRGARGGNFTSQARRGVGQ